MSLANPAVKTLAAMVRRIPVNRWLKGFLIRRAARLRRYRLDFTFRCESLGVLWSASAFPDELTRHMLFEGMYQQDVLVTLQALIRQGDIVYDVGGHHGLMAIMSAKATGPSGTVITFEPNPNARVHLEKHLRLNNVDNVVIEDLALSDSEGVATFYVQSGDVTWNSTLVREFAANNRATSAISTATVTLDSYVSRRSLVPRIVKIDTEGSEFLVLQGARETLKKYRPILIVEFNPLSAQAAGTTVESYVRFLSDQDYSMIVLRKNALGYYRWTNQEPFDQHKHARTDNQVNVICIPLERRAEMVDHRVPSHD